jgi:hypothetical protein
MRMGVRVVGVNNGVMAETRSWRTYLVYLP